MAKQHYLVLARKWRPQTFEDVIGQEHITRTLQNALASGRIGHAFLFIGSRGIGKTTTARILAKALNCTASEGPTPQPCGKCDNCQTIATGNNIDVVEIDAASNNGVDNVREIRENIRLVPSRSRYKIYIIDEVHQLSSGAFNALLKTLEEPPAHAVFILATTEAAKIPATIVSRCQRYDFRRVGLGRINELLTRILEAEGVACSQEALHAIARAADGGIRDAESILEQLISFCDKEITYQDVYDVLGLVDWRVFHEMCDAILDRNVVRLLEIVEEIVVIGKDLSQFVQDTLQYFRNLLICKTADPTKLLALPEDEIAAMTRRAERFSLTELIRLVEQFADLSKDFDSQLAQRIALEAMLIRVSKLAVEVSVDTVLEKLLKLETALHTAPSTVLATSGDSSASARPRTPTAQRSASEEDSKAPPEAPLESPPRPFDDTVHEEPAKDRRTEVTGDNMRTVWSDVCTQTSGDALGLGIWLTHARPVGIEGDALILELGADQSKARATLELPENRARVEAVLRQVTRNIRTFQTGLVEVVRKDVNGHQQRLPFAGMVTEAEAKRALEDVHVAQVVSVFKGRIVDVTRHLKSSGPD